MGGTSSKERERDAAARAQYFGTGERVVYYTRTVPPTGAIAPNAKLAEGEFSVEVGAWRSWRAHAN
jgi:hypothetical protein